MGDISIMARRLADGHVQYGWSGNGGTFRIAGARLLFWYSDPDSVEYLFELGQTEFIGKPGSEKGGCRFAETHSLTGEPCWLGRTERVIFSKIAFIDVGYFYDLDHKWYYIIPQPFRIKLPLELIGNHVDDNGHEFKYREEIVRKIAEFIFNEYIYQDTGFVKFLNDEGYDPKSVLEDIMNCVKHPLYDLADKYNKIYKYFDEWIVVKANADNTEIEQIIMRKKEDKHVETCEW